MLTLDLPPHVDEAHARLLLALGLFQEGAIAVGKAAEIAGLSYRAFLDVLRARGIPAFTITEEDWAQDLAHLRRLDADDGDEA
jgi:predicted HTH domain antitoxin